MKHSRLDALLVGLLALQLLLLFLPFVLDLETYALVPLALINVFLMGTNFQCIAHNFIHLPFFSSTPLNNLFSVLNSLGIGVPQTIYRLHHLNHHRFNNRPELDESSTFRHGKNGKEENIFTYSLFGIARTDLVGLFRQVSKNRLLPKVELLTILAVFILCAFIDLKLLVFYLLPCYLAGHFFALWENYCEHHRANPYDRRRDSVSCYSPLYNLIWFNNGYHQEHHFSPQVHWTKIKEVSAQLPDDRVVVKGCHLRNSF